MAYEQMILDSHGCRWKVLEPNVSSRAAPPLKLITYPVSSNFVEVVKRDISIQWYMETFHHAVFERHGAKGKLHWKAHPSFVYTPDKGLFCWNSQGIAGTIVDLVCYMEHLTTEQTWRRLRELLHSTHPSPAPAPAVGKRQKSATLVLPAAYPQNWPRIYAYLCKTRGIEKAVVDWLRKEELLYPTQNNLCYCTRLHGTAVYAVQKGTTPKFWVHVEEGGDYERRFAANITHDTRRLIVTEAFVDACACASLSYRKYGNGWLDYGYHSLECCAPVSLATWVKDLPFLETIYLAQDNDEGGMKSRIACRNTLSSLGFSGKIVDLIPPLDSGKDWADFIRNHPAKP